MTSIFHCKSKTLYLCLVAFGSSMMTYHVIAETEGRVLEEIVVTAQKKSESVNSVPITMTALGGTDLRDLRITDAMDVESYVTNIDIKGTLGGTNPAVTIRGVGLNDFNANNNPAVGVYIDEVFQPSAGMLNFSTFDLTRIEVLKGPQGTLYGRNSNGGAMNYYTTKPTFEAEGYIDVTLGNFDRTEIEGAYSNALSEDWAFRISAKLSNQDENFRENRLGSDFGGSDLSAFRGALRFEGDNLLFDTSLTIGQQSAGFQPFKNRGIIDPADPFVGPCPTAASGNPTQDFSCTSILYGVGGVFFNPDVETFANQDPNDNFYADNIDQSDTETDTLLWIARFDYPISDEITLTSVSSYVDVDKQYQDSVFGSLAGYQYFGSGRDESISQFSQELRINWISDTFEWTTGVFYSKDDVESVSIVNATDTLATIYDIRYEQETTAIAIFSQIEWIFSETLSMEFGLRYSDEERDFEGGTTDLNPFDQSFLVYLPAADGGFGIPFDFTGPVPTTAGTEININDSDVSGRIGINFTPNNNTLIYASISTGFKSGIVFSDITFVPEELGPLAPEDITAYEMGVKLTLANGSAQFNASIFKYDYENIQTQVPTALSLTFTNAEEADINGLEFDLNWQATNNLKLRVGVGWLDSEIDSAGLSGNTLPNAPELQYTFIARYDRSLSNGYAVSGQVDYKYSDQMYKEATNNPLAQTDDYGVANARLTLTSPTGNWETSLWVKNMTDEEYLEHVFIVDFFGITADLYNTPRVYGLTSSYNF